MRASGKLVSMDTQGQRIVTGHDRMLCVFDVNGERVFEKRPERLRQAAGQDYIKTMMDKSA